MATLATNLVNPSHLPLDSVQLGWHSMNRGLSEHCLTPSPTDNPSSIDWVDGLEVSTVTTPEFPAQKPFPSYSGNRLWDKISQVIIQFYQHFTNIYSQVAYVDCVNIIFGLCAVCFRTAGMDMTLTRITKYCQAWLEVPSKHSRMVNPVFGFVCSLSLFSSLLFSLCCFVRVEPNIRFANFCCSRTDDGKLFRPFLSPRASLHSQSNSNEATSSRTKHSVDFCRSFLLLLSLSPHTRLTDRMSLWKS